MYGTCINIFIYTHPIAFLDYCLNSHIGSSVYINRSSCVCINICKTKWLYFGSWINSTVFFLQVLAFSEGLNATTIYNGTCSSYLVPKSWIMNNIGSLFGLCSWSLSWIMFKPFNLGKWPTSSLSSTPTCPAPFGIQGPSGPTVAWDASGASGASGPAAAAATGAASPHDWIYEDGLVKVKGMGHWQYMGIDGDRLILAGKISRCFDDFDIFWSVVSPRNSDLPLILGIWTFAGLAGEIPSFQKNPTPSRMGIYHGVI